MTTIGSLFTGYGGLDQAAEAWYGARTAWVSDIDPGARKILTHRYPEVPNLGDITTIDWSQVTPVDILTGGFPCQDLSAAGKRAGLRPGTRSGLWTHMAYAISQLRPRVVVAENVRGLLSARAHSDVEPCPWCVGGAADGEPDLRALGAVLGDLAELGYDAQWVGLRAADVGAPHGRFRVFVVATDAERGGRYGRAGELGSGRRAEPTDSGHAAADALSVGRDRRSCEPVRGPVERVAATGGRPADRRRESTAADAHHAAHHGERACAEPWSRGAPAADADADERTRERVQQPRRDAAAWGSSTNWGQYRPAVERWERTLGRPAPAPTEMSARGSQRLSPRFVEWMMGIPAGWVTEVPRISRNAQLKALGNGVVPQQAYEALRIISARQGLEVAA